MRPEWYVLGPDCRKVAGPFATEQAAVRHTVLVLREAKRKGLLLGPLLPLRKPLVFDGSSAFYTSLSEVPKAAIRAQRSGDMILVRREDGLAEARTLP